MLRQLTTNVRSGLGRIAVAAVLIGLAIPASGSAQTPSAGFDARWLPWVGCWRPADQSSGADGLHVCVVPASASGVRIITIAGDRVVREEPVVPDGSSRAIDEPGCRGSLKSEWSADGLRIYSNGESACENDAPRTVSALSLLTGDAEWIDVQVVTVARQEGVRLRRYRRSNDQPPDPSLIPPDLRARADHVALGVRLSIDHVIDASRHVAPRVIEALLFETRPVFPINSRQLIALGNGGVAGPVIDLMVAFSFPGKFDVRRSGVRPVPGYGGGGYPFAEEELAESAWPWYYDRYYAFDSPFAYWRWGYWGGGYDIFPESGFIVSGGPEKPSFTPFPHGKVVNGTGYTQVVTKEATGKPGSGSDGGGSSSSSSSSSSASSASSSGYSSGGGGGGDGGRTAVPR